MICYVALTDVNHKKISKFVLDLKSQTQNSMDDTNSMDDQTLEEIPKIRKRVTKETVLSELDETITKLDVKIEKLKKTMGGQSGSRFLRGLRNRLVKIRRNAKRMKRRRTCTPTSTVYEVSDELAKFLKLDEPQISRLNLQWAISAYIHIADDEKREGILSWKHLNPNNRDLRNPENRKIVLPDAKLSKLLRYDRYRKMVAKGKITVMSTDKTTGDKTTRIYEDDALRYWVVMRLLQPHLTRVHLSERNTPLQS